VSSGNQNQRRRKIGRRRIEQSRRQRRSIISEGVSAA